jgi:phage FluMu protein Com
MASVKPLYERQKDFIKRLERLYPDYELLSEYKDSKTKVTLKHVPTGEIWKIEPRNLNGRKQAPKLTQARIKENRKKNKYSTAKWTQEKFECEFYKKFSFSEYEVVGEYINQSSYIDILHRKCGKIFSKSTAANLLYHNQKGCPFCYGKIKRTVESTNNELLEKGYEDYSVTKIKTIDGHVYGHFIHKCELCNKYEFDMRLSDFFSKHNYKCPKCKILSTESRGIKEITEYLKDNQIEFEQEVSFEECVDKTYLPFDIYIESMNIIIEFDGQQHFKPYKYFGGEAKFKIRKKHDEIKNNFCKEYGINLLRISYKDDIQEKLNNYFENNV